MDQCPYCGQSEPVDPVEDLYTLDENSRTLRVGGQKRRFSPKRWKIVKKLAAASPDFVNKDALMTLLYSDCADPPFDTIIANHICHIRNRLEGTDMKIENHWGGDWRLIKKD
jgi:DNA-binding response OmpR family regulator